MSSLNETTFFHYPRTIDPFFFCKRVASQHGRPKRREGQSHQKTVREEEEEDGEREKTLRNSLPPLLSRPIYPWDHTDWRRGGREGHLSHLKSIVRERRGGAPLMEAAWLPPSSDALVASADGQAPRQGGRVSAPCGRPRDNKPDRPPTYVRNACAAVGGGGGDPTRFSQKRKKGWMLKFFC